MVWVNANAKLQDGQTVSHQVRADFLKGAMAGRCAAASPCVDVARPGEGLFP